MAVGERALDLLAQQEWRVVDQIAHLDVVLQRHVGDGVGIGLAAALEFGESGAIVATVTEQGIQRDAVLERAVHALAVERHDGVGGVAQQQRGAVEMPGVEAQGAQ